MYILRYKYFWIAMLYTYILGILLNIVGVSTGWFWGLFVLWLIVVNFWVQSHLRDDIASGKFNPHGKDDKDGDNK